MSSRGTGSLPPVGAFWSFTAYDAEGYIVKNSMKRYALHDWDPLTYAPDGSLTLYFGDSPPFTPSSTLSSLLLFTHPRILLARPFTPSVHRRQPAPVQQLAADPLLQLHAHRTLLLAGPVAAQPLLDAATPQADGVMLGRGSSGLGGGRVGPPWLRCAATRDELRP